MKIVRQKLEENRRVYEGGRLEKNAVKMQSEAEQITAERSRDSFQEGEQAEVREQPRSAEELREPKETILVREEQELFEPSEAASTGADSIREISDELERLAQRYGRGMEEWLYDQSARNNPRRLVVLHRKRTASAICCGFGESLQQLGPGLSEVQGEGELFGEDAMEQFAQLRALMEGGSGVLSGAGLEPMRAVLESLQMTGSGGEAIIGYRFRFIEERKEG